MLSCGGELCHLPWGTAVCVSIFTQPEQDPAPTLLFRPQTGVSTTEIAFGGIKHLKAFAKVQKCEESHELRRMSTEQQHAEEGER